MSLGYGLVRKTEKVSMEEMEGMEGMEEMEENVDGGVCVVGRAGFWCGKTCEVRRFTVSLSCDWVKKWKKFGGGDGGNGGKGGDGGKCG